MMMSKRTSLGMLIFSGLLVFIGYLPGLSGALYYDDYANLDGLSGVVDASTAVAFVFGGNAGPLGRPLALASFLPFSEGWPNNSEIALACNLVIHIANFYLVYLLGVLLLQRTEYVASDKVKLVALASAFLWAVLPILASTTLILIQRMTSLSAMFGLLGLVAFTYGYRWSDRSPLLGACFQLFFLAAGTLLAIFTKESGALIPVFALIIDFLCRGGSGQWRQGEILRRGVLFFLFLAVVYQVSPLKIDYFAHDDFRGYSAVQRLITEVVVLWEYLVRAFIPQQPTAFGPFHDYYGIRGIDGVFYLSIGGWLFLFLSAVVLRKKSPLFLFALAWFAVGHLIESTAVMLEIYFEHRNYLAVYGFCLFLSWGAFNLSRLIGKVVWIGFASYTLLMWVLLFMMTSIWGDKKEAAETWAAKHPGSARAALHAVFIDLGSAPEGEGNEYLGNQRYIERERQNYALRVLDRTMSACPDCIDVRLQALVFSCQLDRVDEQKPRLEGISSIVKNGIVTPSVISLSHDIANLVASNKCSGISINDLSNLFVALHENPALDFPAYSGKLYFAQAMLFEAAGDWEAVKKILLDGEGVAPDAVPILQYQIYAAMQSADHEYGSSALERRRDLTGHWEGQDGKETLLSLRQLLEQ